jgi:quercetin 2,3-dioxygenase
MKKIIRANERYLSDYGTIKSHFLFSFADYHDPSNHHWWDLRVFNDDFVWVGAWFPMHPHKNFEIMTIMLRGTLTHADSLGNKETIRAGEVQVTNTGSWISHSEFNEGDENVYLYQLWFSPKKPTITPTYYTAKFHPAEMENTLLTLASGIENSPYKLISDVSVKRWIFRSGETIEIDAQNHIFIYVTSWSIRIDTDVVWERDQFRSMKEGILKIMFLERSEIIVIESR